MGVRAIQTELGSARRWADMVEHVPEMILSSIEQKLSSGESADSLLNFISLSQWAQKALNHLSTSKAGLIRSKIESKKKEELVCDFELIRTKLSKRMDFFEHDFPALYTNLSSRMNLQILTQPLSLEPAQKLISNEESGV